MNKTKDMTIPERAEYMVELTELPCRKNHEKQLRIVAFELMQKIKQDYNKWYKKLWRWLCKKVI